MQGLQYETVNLGPPKPPCNQDRVATLRALDCTDGPSNPELGPLALVSHPCPCSGSLAVPRQAVVALSVGSLIAGAEICKSISEAEGQRAWVRISPGCQTRHESMRGGA